MIIELTDDQMKELQETGRIDIRNEYGSVTITADR